MNFTAEKKQDGDHILNYLIEKVIRQRENIIVFVTGQTGRGKSYAALRLMEAIHKRVYELLKTENIPYDGSYPKKVSIEQVATSGQEFLKIVNAPAKPYTCVLFDEVGVSQGGAAARKWASDLNNALVDVTQTFRNLQLFTIYTAPDDSYLDSKMRNLVHVLITMKKKYVQQNVSMAKVYFCEIANNPFTTQARYNWRPRIKDKEGKRIVNRLFFRKPGFVLCDAYELKIAARKKEIRMLSEKKLLDNALNSKLKMKTDDKYNKIAKEIYESDVEDMDETDVMAQFGVGRTAAKVVLKKVGLVGKNTNNAFISNAVAATVEQIKKNPVDVTAELIARTYDIDLKKAQRIRRLANKRRLVEIKKERIAAGLIPDES